MGILSGLFVSKKKASNNEVKTENIIENNNPIREITTIIEILGNLGLLDEKEIDRRLDEKYKDYDHSILKRLMIKTEPSNIDCIENYLKHADIGFGIVRTNQFKNRLYEINRESLSLGKNRQEIIEELIEATKIEIETYEKVLKALNETVKNLEENSPTDADKLVMMDYWITFYKEQELGYPVNLDSKIEDMVQELAKLPYSGYGEIELKKFKEAAKKYAEEGRLVGENSSQTYNRIKSALFEPKKNRFLSDVETLKRKIRMIDESPYLKSDEKENNKELLIVEFNQMNGHSLNIEGTIKQLKLNLELLEYGGYGKEIITEFVDKANKIAENEKDLKQKDIIDAIKREYNVLVSDYDAELTKMKDKLKQIDTELIPLSEKQRKKEDIIEDFRDSMGHELDYKERINKMIAGLKELEHGGYGDSIINEFKDKAISLVKDAKSDFEVAKAMKEIRRLYNRLITEYRAKLELFLEKIRKIRSDTTLDLESQEEKIEQLEKDFKFSLGFRMNFNKIIRDFAKELSSLEKGGYGDIAIDEFKDECEEILKKEIEEKEKYNMIKHKFSILKTRYLSNVRIFANWKMMMLNVAKDEEKEKLSQELDSKIIYMLSLSPKGLTDYYLADDKKRKEETDEYNTIAACKFLARKEAEYHDNKEIYKMRLSEIKKGNLPYSQEKIDKAKQKLQMLTLTNDDEIDDDTRQVTIIDYIDSTLLSQMLKAELQDKNSN